jgi:gliding motility-associated-like protein
MKFSSDGTKASLAVPGKNIVQVYDFDRATGIFSNPVQISVTTPAAVEFSPDNSKLYVGTDGDHNLYQYDLASIVTAPVVISTNPGLSYDDLHLAPDGRIFVALGNSGTIGIINNTDISGTASDYTSQSGVINTNTSLPSIITNYFTTKSWTIAYMDTCVNSPTLVQFTAPDSVRNWTWYFDNVADPQVNFPGSQTTQHTFTTPGPHPVRLVVNHHCGTKDTTITINIAPAPVVNLPASITVCVAGDSAKLDATNPNSTYVWSTGETTPVIYAKTPATYSVVVTNTAGCVASGSTNVNFLNNPGFDLGNDTTLCFGQILTLNSGAASTTWNGVPGGPTFPVSATGQYIAEVNFGACSIKDTVNVKVLPQLSVNLGTNDTLCLGAPAKLLGIPDPYPGVAKYVWSTVANPGTVLGNTSFLSVSTSGDYILLDSIDHCYAADTVHIEFIAPPTTPNLGAANTYCVNSFQTLDAGSAGVPGVSYLWSPNGATTRQTTVSSGSQGPVTYSVVVTIGKGGASGGCSASAQVTYTYVTPPIIYLGPASATYCEGNSITLDADPGNTHPSFTYLWNPGGETTSSITATTTGVYSVMAKQGSCFSAPASKNLIFNPSPAISLPPQVVYCKSKQPSAVIRLSGGSPAYTYQWNGGPSTTADTLEVFQEGTNSVKATLGNCPTTISTDVVSICEANLYIPTAFSPNGDAVNPEYKLFGEGIEELDFRIYDRWGELIFVFTDLSQTWDGKYKGKFVQEGVYIWKVTYSGKSESGLTKYSRDGDLTVIK